MRAVSESGTSGGARGEAWCRVALLCAAGFALPALPSAPEAALVQAMANLAWLVGAGAALVRLHRAVSSERANAKGEAPAHEHAHRAASAFVAGGAVAWVIAWLGDALVAGASGTGAVARLVALAVIAFGVLRAVERWGGAEACDARRVAPPRPPPARSGDALVKAVHEVGHLLAHAPLERLPADFAVWLERDRRGAVTGGAVSGIPRPTRNPSRSWAEWEMTMVLAGDRAQRHLLGEEMINGFARAGSDQRRWQRMARGVLAQQLRGTYFLEPVTAAEVAHNAAMTRRLREEQLAELDRLFEANAHTLWRAATELAETARLDTGRCRAYLATVSVPATFPSPTSIERRLRTLHDGAGGERRSTRGWNA